MIDFDRWRADYPSMSFAQQVEWYRLGYAAYPDQHNYDSAAIQRFLSWSKPHHIVEIGGWRGELANEMLAAFPLVESWTNYEISPGAVAHTVCTDPRYSAQVPADWPWEIDISSGRDALIASHVIEHMRATELETLLRRVSEDVDSMYLASPLDSQGRSWDHYQGTHILEIGWDGIDEILADLAFIEHEQFRTAEVRCYWTPR